MINHPPYSDKRHSFISQLNINVTSILIYSLYFYTISIFILPYPLNRDFLYSCYLLSVLTYVDIISKRPIHIDRLCILKFNCVFSDLSEGFILGSCLSIAVGLCSVSFHTLTVTIHILKSLTNNHHHRSR